MIRLCSTLLINAIEEIQMNNDRLDSKIWILANLGGVNKIAMKSFSKICCSKSTLNCKSPATHV